MKVICISGKARAGKDSFANMLKDELESHGHSVLITHYADLLKYIAYQFFDWDGKKDIAGRYLLQYIGTDKIRKKSPDYWVNFIAGILTFFKGEWEYVLIPDTRFENEIEILDTYEFYPYHIRIERPNFDNGLTEEQKAHISETALDNYLANTYIINDGTLDDLRKSVLKFVGSVLLNKDENVFGTGIVELCEEAEQEPCEN